MTTPVSGPGQFSKRTDRAVSAASESLPNAQYGENRDYQDIKSAAPMAGGAEAPPMNLQQLFSGMGQDVVPLDAESAMPDVPVTDGAALGPGAGTEVLGQEPSGESEEMLAYLPVLEYMANTGRSDAARNLVRQIKYSI